MRVLMTPGPKKSAQGDVGGINTVIQNYAKHLPEHGIEIVEGDEPSYDVHAVHAGASPFRMERGANVVFIHGLYWTAEQPMGRSYHVVNQRVIDNIKHATCVVVPSDWVAEVIRREFSINPYVIPHGINLAEWGGAVFPDREYVLWAKNRYSDVCSPALAVEAARLLPETQFYMTFGKRLPNVFVEGRALTTQEMRDRMMQCSVYLSTTPETFGIATLEAMAAGKPVVTVKRGNYGLVEHGVTGYVALPNNPEDLANGIRWCLENKERLGKNARFRAKKYQWSTIAGDVAQVFVDAHSSRKESKRQAAKVAFIVPAYNKSGTIKMTLDSIVGQSEFEKHDVHTYVVDDASTDNVQDVINGYKKNLNIHYIRLEENSGVSHARNTGAAAAVKSGADYLAFLDADDMVASDWLAETLKNLRYSNNNGVAYTGLTRLSDGSLSPWPKEFNFEAQQAGRNQVPTCALVRATAWERVGGFRGRYNRFNDLGYGSEDAAFWLDVARLGYNITRVTSKGLFIYNDGQGGTSNPDYTEIPWSNFWKEPRLPTPTPPDVIAWPARSYTPPKISVIITVGPGHEQYAQDAIDSVIAQDFHHTEIIVVWDSPQKIPHWYSTGYPFVKIVTGAESMGPARARNLGMEMATCDLVIFLDGDDMLKPGFITKSVVAWNEHRSIIYTDFEGAQKLRGRVPEGVEGWHRYDKAADIIYFFGRLKDFTPELAARQPDYTQDGIWSPPVTCLYPKKWVQDVGGFNEDIESWEDWLLHITLAKSGKPYYRIAEPLLFYRMYSGRRREEAFGIKDELLDKIKELSS